MIRTLPLLAALVGCGDSAPEANPAPHGDHAGHAHHQDHAGHAHHQDHTGHEGHEGHEEMPAGEATLGASLYGLEIELTDQEGQALPFDTFKGHPVLVSMIYTSCTTACPAIVSQMQGIEISAPPEQREDLRFLLVSFDSERDDPAALTALAERHNLDTTRWKLASASEGHVRELAAVLGIRYRALPTGDFNHSSLVTLLDSQGEIVARVENFGKKDRILDKLAEISR